MSINFNETQLEMLHQPLNVSVIKHRPGGRGMLKYIKGDTAIDTANSIFGFGQWGYKVVSRSHEVIDDEKKGKIEFYTADIELSVVGAAFSFPGDGVGIVNAPYTVEMHEKARKEATTDALKRALRHYGDQFGLSLYDEDDYVDAGNGELIQVKEVKPGMAKQQQPKRIVDAGNAPKQIPSPISSQQPAAQPVIAQPESKPPTLRERFENTYRRALALKQFSFKADASDKEKIQAFLDFAGPIVNATLSSAGHLTMTRLNEIDAYLSSQDAA